MLGRGMHDVALSAWGIKGWYDYIRPISAIRYMVDRDKSSDDQLPSYHEDGIPLVDDYIELVEQGDPLAAEKNEHVGNIKLKAWKGSDYISNPDTDVAGVDWILGENWWPYQRPTFITSPFAGYVSGHSTYSRGAAELPTLLTRDSYFPNGLGKFIALKDDFLVFENGPSETITLQWATYQDTSDQCSLSRIWGGIHASSVDIPRRIIGKAIGKEAYAFAQQYFLANPLGARPSQTIGLLYPNPTSDLLKIKLLNREGISTATILNLNGQIIRTERFQDNMELNIRQLIPRNCLVKIENSKWNSSHFVIKN